MSTRDLADDQEHGSHQENMFCRLVESQERLVKSQEILVKSQERLVESLEERLVESQERLVKSQERMIESLKERLFESQEVTFERLEGMLSKLINCQAKSQRKTSTLGNTSSEQKDEEESLKDLLAAEGGKIHSSAVDQEDITLAQVLGDNDDAEQMQSPESEGGHPLLDYEPLIHAAKAGDWKKAIEYFDQYPQVVTQGIITVFETALNIAVINMHTKFVWEAVRFMPGALFHPTCDRGGLTVLHVAARYGNHMAAAIFLSENSDLALVPDKNGWIPLKHALNCVTVGQTATIQILYETTRVERRHFVGSDGASLLCSAIDANCYDVALDIVARFPELAMKTSLEHNMCGLELVVLKPYAFLSGDKLTWWQHKIYSLIPGGLTSVSFKFKRLRDEENPSNISVVDSASELPAVNCLTVLLIRASHRIRKVYRKKLTHRRTSALVKCMFEHVRKTMKDDEVVNSFTDTKLIKTSIRQRGTTDFVEECLRNFPFLITRRISGQTLIQMAIEERNERILKLIYETANKDEIFDLVFRRDDSNNTILHHAAALASSVHINLVSGAALQMQRELQWFKGVESLLPETHKFIRNTEERTAQEIFAL